MRPLLSSLKSACALIALAAPVALSAQTSPVTSGAAAIASPAAEIELVALPDFITSDLPRFARPTHYSIEIIPDAKTLTFTGKVGIDLTIFAATNTLTLHGNGLAVSSAKLVPASGGAPIVLTTTAEAPAQLLHFAAPSSVQPGSYRLDIAYAGVIGTQASGLFALDYPDKRGGKTVRGLFTQFEAPDARKFVPSFDEPSYKATFDLAAIVPASQMAISNMPIASSQGLSGGRKRVTFGTTPQMSTYLLFFGLGDFERTTKVSADGVEVGIVAPVGSGKQADYARDTLAEVMPWFGDYFGVKYSLPKLDNVVAPGSSQFFGAMENWGAIMTFERILLRDPATTSPSGVQAIFNTQAHEVAHQWFGNRVTMAWWGDLWLNEGFASWISDKVTDQLRPEWDWKLSGIDGREDAMSLDALSSTHPIVQTIRTVSEMEQAFDAITYKKGQAIIGMLEDYVGQDVWRAGIRSYMARYAHMNTQSKDLWSAIEGAGAKDVNLVADAFTRIPGVPLVRVTVSACKGGQTRLQLSQDAFSLDPADRNGEKPLWPMPLLIRVGDQQPVRHLMTAKSDAVVLPGCGTVLVNSGQLGYFRTLYDNAAIGQLTTRYAGLAPIDQYGLLRDNLSLSLAGYQDMAVGLNLLSAVPTNAKAQMASNVASLWQSVFGVLTDEGAKSQLGALISQRLEPRLQALGFDPVEGEPLNDTALRAQLIATLGGIGAPVVSAEARRRLAALPTKPDVLDGPLKRVWLEAAARAATRSDWDLMRVQAGKATSIVERQLYYSALGLAVDENLAKATLALALSGTPDATSASQMIAAVGRVHPELAFDFVRENQDAMNNLVETAGRARFINRLVAASTDPAMIEKLETYASSLPSDQAKPVNAALSSLKQRLATRPAQRAQTVAWLAGLRK